jgi:hypothetical protein
MSKKSVRKPKHPRGCMLLTVPADIDVRTPQFRDGKIVSSGFGRYPQVIKSVVDLRDDYITPGPRSITSTPRGTLNGQKPFGYGKSAEDWALSHM